MPALGRDFIRKLMLKQAKPSPNISKHIANPKHVKYPAARELDELLDDIDSLEDIKKKYAGKKEPKLGRQERAEMDMYGEVIGGGMPPSVKSLPGTMPVKGPNGWQMPGDKKINWKNLPPDLDATPGPDGKYSVTGETPKKPLPKAEKARQRRAWKQGYRTTAYMGSGKAWDPTQPRASGSKIRWFADTPEAAETYMTGKQKATDHWAQTDPSPIEDNANLAPVKLKLGKTLVVDAGGAEWDRLRLPNIKDKTVMEKFKNTLYDDRFATDDVARWAEQNGYDSVTFRNIKDNLSLNYQAKPHNVYAMINQKNIRGKFAKFENKNRGKLADLLAGGVLAAGAGTSLSTEKEG